MDPGCLLHSGRRTRGMRAPRAAVPLLANPNPTTQIFQRTKFHARGSTHRGAMIRLIGWLTTVVEVKARLHMAGNRSTALRLPRGILHPQTVFCMETRTRMILIFCCPSIPHVALRPGRAREDHLPWYALLCLSLAPLDEGLAWQPSLTIICAMAKGVARHWYLYSEGTKSEQPCTGRNRPGDAYGSVCFNELAPERHR
jgi:hypothetical protein